LNLDDESDDANTTPANSDQTKAATTAYVSVNPIERRVVGSIPDT